MRRAAVMVGIAEVSMLIANHLQWFTQLNQCRGQTCQADYSEKNKSKEHEKYTISHECMDCYCESMMK